MEVSNDDGAVKNLSDFLEFLTIGVAQLTVHKTERSQWIIVTNYGLRYVPLMKFKELIDNPFTYEDNVYWCTDVTIHKKENFNYFKAETEAITRLSTRSDVIVIEFRTQEAFFGISYPELSNNSSNGTFSEINNRLKRDFGDDFIALALKLCRTTESLFPVDFNADCVIGDSNTVELIMTALTSKMSVRRFFHFIEDILSFYQEKMMLSDINVMFEHEKVKITLAITLLQKTTGYVRAKIVSTRAFMDMNAKPTSQLKRRDRADKYFIGKRTRTDEH